MRERPAPHTPRDICGQKEWGSVNFDGLADFSGEAIIDQDVIVGGDDSVPIRALRKGRGGFAIGQGDCTGQINTFARQARDKQANHY